MDAKMVETEARLYASQVGRQIADKANTKEPDERASFAGAAASMVLQNIVLSMVIREHQPGTIGGELRIREIYQSALLDAVERWHKSDLKEMRARGII